MSGRNLKLNTSGSSETEELDIPITPGGRFMEDDFFKNAREKFNQEIEEFHKSFGKSSSSLFSPMSDDEFFNKKSMMKGFDDEEFFNSDEGSGMRKSSSSQAKKEISAVEDVCRVISVKAEGNIYKLLLDVSNFDGKIGLKVINREELLVEGDSQYGGFQQSFHFPNIQEKDVSSLMSSDGILTINVPVEVSPGQTLSNNLSSSSNSQQHQSIDIIKMESFFSSVEFLNVRHKFTTAVCKILEKFDIPIEAGREIDLYRAFRKVNSDEESQLIFHTDLDRQFMILLDMDGYSEKDIKVTLIDKSELLVETQRYDESGQCLRFTRIFNIPPNLHYTSITSVLSTENILIIYLIKEERSKRLSVKMHQEKEAASMKTDIRATFNKSSSHQESQNSTTQSTRSVTSQQETQNSTSTKSGFTFDSQKTSNRDKERFFVSSNFTVMRKREFFKDVFFKESTTHFTKILKRLYKIEATNTEEVWKSYKEIVSNKDKSIVNSTVQQNDLYFKILLDVSNLRIDSLNIYKVGFNEIVVEGIVDSGKSSPQSPQRVSKTFVITEDIEDDQIVESFLSSDGVLLIQVEKEEAKELNEGKPKVLDDASFDKKWAPDESDAMSRREDTHLDEKKVEKLTNKTDTTKFSKQMLFDSSKIHRRGRFETDTFFSVEMRFLLYTIRKAMQSSTIKTYTLESYRKFLQKNSIQENRANEIEWTDNYTKILIDVNDLREDSISLSQTEDGICIEGLTKTGQKFSKVFELATVEFASSSTLFLSQDGFLLVKVPNISPACLPEEDLSPPALQSPQAEADSTTPQYTVCSPPPTAEVTSPNALSSCSTIPDLMSANEMECETPTVTIQSPRASDKATKSLPPVVIEDVPDEETQKEKEAEKRRKMEEAEEKRKAKEAEEKRKMEEAEEKKKAKESEERKKIKEAEEKKKMEEAEEKRKVKEAEERKKMKEAEEKEKIKDGEERNKMNKIKEVEEKFKFYNSEHQDQDFADFSAIKIKSQKDFLEDAVFKNFKQEVNENLSQILLNNEISNTEGNNWKSYTKARNAGLLSNCFVMSAQHIDKYLIMMDTFDFVSGSIIVRTIGKYQVEIKAEYKRPKGSVFKRSYFFPEPVENIEAFLTSDGMLLITAKYLVKDGKRIEDRFSQITLSYDEYDKEVKKVTQDDLNLLYSRSQDQIMSQSSLAKIDSNFGLDQSLSKIDLDKLIFLSSTTLPTLKTRSSIFHEYLEEIYLELVLRIAASLKTFASMTGHDIKVPSDDKEMMKLYQSICSKYPKDMKRACIVLNSNVEVFQIILDMTEQYKDQFFISIIEKSTIVVQCFSKTQTKDLKCSFRRHFSLPHNFQIATMSSILTSDGFLIITFTQEEDAPYNRDLVRQISETNENNDDFLRYIIDFSQTKADEKSSGTPKITELGVDEDLDDITDNKGCFQMKKIPNYMSNSKYDSCDSKFTRKMINILRTKFKDSSMEGNDDSAASLKEVFSKYSSKRKEDFTEETQAGVMIQGEEYFKIIIDSVNVIEKSIRIKLNSSKQLDANATYKTGNTSYKYNDKFYFDNDIDESSVEVNKSDDGLIVITGKLIKPIKTKTEEPKLERSVSIDKPTTPSGLTQSEEDVVSAVRMKLNKKLGKKPENTSETEQKSPEVASDNDPMKKMASTPVKNAASEPTPSTKENKSETADKSKKNKLDLKVNIEKPKDTIAKAEERTNDPPKTPKPSGQSSLNRQKSVTDGKIIAVEDTGSFFSSAVTNEELQSNMKKSIVDKLKTYNIAVKSKPFEQLRLLRRQNNSSETQVFSVSYYGNKYRLALDVSGFHKDELEVFATEFGYLLIEGWVNQSYSEGYPRSDFKRRFCLPGDVDITTISSSLASDGFLIVTGTICPKSSRVLKTQWSTSDLEELSHYTDISSLKSNDSPDVTDVLDLTKSSGESLEDHILIPKKRDRNFVDLYGQSSYDSFVGSVNTTMKSYGCPVSKDVMSSYRKLRMKNSSMETQATCYTSRGDYDLVVIDVMEFLRGAIRITLRGRYVLVEGFAEVLIDGVLTVFMFRRIYKLKKDIFECFVVAEISSDGLLALSFRENSTDLDMSQANIKRITFKQRLPIKDNETKSSTLDSKGDKSPVKSRQPGRELTGNQNYLPIDRIPSFFNVRKYESCNGNLMDGLKSVFRSQFHDLSFDSTDYSRKSLVEAFEKYRTHRRRNFRVDSQIALLIQDNQSFKIIIDVLDSVSGSVRTWTSSPKQITVEAVMELRSDGSSTCYDFRRTFNLSHEIKQSSISSEQSDDGILIITGNTKYVEAMNTEEIRQSAIKSVPSTPIAAPVVESGKTHYTRKLFNKDYTLNISSNGTLYTGDVSESTQRNLMKSFINILNKFNIEVGTDVFSQYKSLRESIYTYDTQVFAITRSGSKYQITVDAHGYKLEELKVNCTTNGFIIVSGTVNKKYDTRFKRCNFTRCYFLPSYVDFSSLNASLTKDGFLTVTGELTFNMSKNSSWMRAGLDSARISDVTEVFDTRKLEKEVLLDDVDSSSATGSQGSPLSLKERDSMFMSGYSKTVVESFMSSVRRILRQNSCLSCEDLMAGYRALRMMNLQEDTQAWSIYDEDNHSMLMLDVSDFIDGDVNIEVIDDSYILIEGQIEKPYDDMYALYTFKRYFKLSKSIHRMASLTEITKDGILVITLTDKMELPKPQQPIVKKEARSPAPLAKCGSLLAKSGSCTEFCEVRRKGKKSCCSGPSGYSKHFLCPSRRPRKHAPAPAQSP